MDGFRHGGVLEQRSSTSACGSGHIGGSDKPPLLVRMPTAGRVVSLGTCTKVCAISFTLGVFVGFTLKRRLRRWVAKMLKRMKDD